MRGTELPTYDIGDRLAEGLQQDTGMRTAPLRAIGVGQNAFANEVFMDESRRSSASIRSSSGCAISKRPRARHVIEEVARMADWGRNAPGRGLGIAYLDYCGTQVAGIAEVSVDRAAGAIKVHHFWCAIDAACRCIPTT